MNIMISAPGQNCRSSAFGPTKWLRMTSVGATKRAICGSASERNAHAHVETFLAAVRECRSHFRCASDQCHDDEADECRVSPN